MYRCPLCGKEFKTLYGLKAHFKLKHPLTYKCPCCGRVFSKQERLREHITKSATKVARKIMERDKLDNIDICHAVFFTLTASSTGKNNSRKRRSKIKKILAEAVEKELISNN